MFPCSSKSPHSPPHHISYKYTLSAPPLPSPQTSLLLYFSTIAIRRPQKIIINHTLNYLCSNFCYPRAPRRKRRRVSQVSRVVSNSLTTAHRTDPNHHLPPPRNVWISHSPIKYTPTRTTTFTATDKNSLRTELFLFPKFNWPTKPHKNTKHQPFISARGVAQYFLLSTEDTKHEAIELGTWEAETDKIIPRWNSQSSRTRWLWIILAYSLPLLSKQHLWDTFDYYTYCNINQRQFTIPILFPVFIRGHWPRDQSLNCTRRRTIRN